MNQFDKLNKFSKHCDLVIENLKEYLAKIKNEIEEIEVEDIDLENMLLIDVREEEEIASGVIPAKNLLTIPRGKIEFSIKKILEHQDKEIVCYCLKGARGMLATKTLKELGIEAKNLNGGIEKWVNSKKPIKNYLGEFIVN